MIKLDNKCIISKEALTRLYEMAFTDLGWDDDDAKEALNQDLTGWIAEAAERLHKASEIIEDLVFYFDFRIGGKRIGVEPLEIKNARDFLHTKEKE